MKAKKILVERTLLENLLIDLNHIPERAYSAEISARIKRIHQLLEEFDPDAEFEEFWSTLPNKTDKKKTKEQWKKLLKEGVRPEDIHAGVPEYHRKETERFRSDPDGFQRHSPFRWLRDRRFEDEPPTPMVDESRLASLLGRMENIPGWNLAFGAEEIAVLSQVIHELEDLSDDTWNRITSMYAPTAMAEQKRARLGIYIPNRLTFLKNPSGTVTNAHRWKDGPRNGLNVIRFQDKLSDEDRKAGASAIKGLKEALK